MTTMLKIFRMPILAVAVFTGLLFAPANMNAENEAATYNLGGHTVKQLNEKLTQAEKARAWTLVAKEACEHYKAELTKQVKSKKGDEAKTISEKIANLDDCISNDAQGLKDIDGYIAAIEAELAKRESSEKEDARTVDAIK